MPPQLNRRQLLGASLVGCGLAGTAAPGQSSAGEPAEFTERERSVPIADDCDVVVCGGGPAGIAAAVYAARAGASVRLLELHGCLGGIWTSGMLANVIDAAKPGLNTEISTRLDALEAFGGHNGPYASYVYDVEAMKFVVEDLCLSAGIKVQLHTRVVAAHTDASNRLTTIVTESKSGRQAWRGKVFIDTTGDGDLGALAGCRWQFGQDADCPCQPMSLMGVITAPPETLARYNADVEKGAKDRLREQLNRAGLEPSYGKPTLFHLNGAIAAVMLNHEYGVRPFDAADVTEATFRARRELFELIRGLKSLGDEWSGVRLVATAEQIGIRDGRRLRGRYELTVDDVVKGARHDDAICRSGFCVDIHATSLAENKRAAYGSGGVKAKPFDIPLRALVAADVDGLLMAGRCISGDFIAHASYRVTGNAVAMGEAAGVTAAIASREQVLPHQVASEAVSQQLAAFRDAKPATS